MRRSNYAAPQRGKCLLNRTGLSDVGRPADQQDPLRPASGEFPYSLGLRVAAFDLNPRKCSVLILQLLNRNPDCAKNPFREKGMPNPGVGIQVGRDLTGALNHYRLVRKLGTSGQDSLAQLAGLGRGEVKIRKKNVPVRQLFASDLELGYVSRC